MTKLKIAIVGYGNIGKYAVDAVNAASDMELVGVVVRDVDKYCAGDVKLVTDISELGGVDVAILTVPSRQSPEYAMRLLGMGIDVVDSYDIHSDIWDVREVLDSCAKKHNASAIISAGWDPGSDSVIRAVMEAAAPKGITYTNFGPGMSMGHTVAAKAINGVKNALSITIPLGTGIHRRMLYIELEDGADISEVKKSILADPYFSHDETHIMPVNDVNIIIDMGHGVNIVRKGVSGDTHNQYFEFNMKVNNPAMTAQVLTSAARAVVKQLPGAYTLIEIPVIDMLCGDRESLVRRLV